MRRRLKPRPNFATLQPWCLITGPGRQNKMVTLCVFCDLLLIYKILTTSSDVWCIYLKNKRSALKTLTGSEAIWEKNVFF